MAGTVHARRDPEVIPVKLNYLKWFNSVIDGRVHWLAALDMRGTNLEILEKCAELSSYTGCDGYSLAHYGGAPLENLKVVNKGLRKSKWSKLLF